MKCWWSLCDRRAALASHPIRYSSGLKLYTFPICERTASLGLPRVVMYSAAL